jgi:hypothetical protein
VIGQDPEHPSVGQADPVFRAIAGEDPVALRITIVDVAAHGADLIRRARQQADIDATRVVPVDEHHAGKRAAGG